MSPQSFAILSRHKPQMTKAAAAGDLVADFSRPLSPQDLRGLDFTPYAFDTETKDLVEVGVPRALPAQRQPFFYLDQFTDAVALRHIPVQTLARRPLPAHLPDVVCIFGIGRTGSTLASKLLAAAGLPSVSEPDILSALADPAAVAKLPLRQAGWSRVYAQCLHSLALRFGSPTQIAIKHRAQSANLFHAERLHAMLPGARHVFMLRDVRQWSLSYTSKFLVGAETLDRILRQNLETASRLLALGGNCRIIFYEDMIARPGEFATSLAGQPFKGSQEADLERVMASDSQDNLIHVTAEKDRMARAMEGRRTFLEKWRARPPLSTLRALGLDGDPRLRLDSTENFGD